MTRDELTREADRLGAIVRTTRDRFNYCRIPKQRAAYKAHMLRAERRYQDHLVKGREAGFSLENIGEGHFTIPMTEEQVAEFRKWRGEPT